MKQITNLEELILNKEYLVRCDEYWYIAKLNGITTYVDEDKTTVYYHWEEESEHYPLTPDYIFELPNTDLLAKTVCNEVD